MENELHKAQALLKRGFEAVFRRSGGKRSARPKRAPWNWRRKGCSAKVKRRSSEAFAC